MATEIIFVLKSVSNVSDVSFYLFVGDFSCELLLELTYQQSDATSGYFSSVRHPGVPAILMC